MFGRWLGKCNIMRDGKVRLCQVEENLFFIKRMGRNKMSEGKARGQD